MTPPNDIQPGAYDLPYSAPVRVGKYTLLAYLYFFFNSLFLPKGLLYTHVLSPLFYFNLVMRGGRTFILPFGVFLLFFNTIHLYNGVDLPTFIVSNGLFVSTYFCVVSFYHFVNHYQDLARLFKNVLLFNAVMVLIAIPFFFMEKQYQEWFWYINKITVGFIDFPRLAMFTYEASYYSLLMIPVFYYYTLKLVFIKFQSVPWVTFSLIMVPMLLSLSFGVLGTTFVTALLMCLFSLRKLFRYKKSFIAVCSAIVVFFGVMLFLWIYFPRNVLFIRIENILTGTDTSANGRMVDSFTMAWRIADMRHLWFGAGLGQIKIMAVEVAHTFYKYWGVMPRYDIPNAMGETLAIFGLWGVALRLVVEWFLFFKTRVYSNHYRLALFIFIFIYQFTGSFITNIVEYAIWVLAFSQIFTQFDVKQRQLPGG